MSNQSEHAPDPAESAEAAAFITALHRTADGLPSADGLSLVSGGYARGRRLRRRRAAVVTAGVAVLALAGSGGVLAAGSGHGSGHGGTETGVAAAPRLASGSRTSTSPAAPTVSFRQTPKPVSARQMEDLLVSLLPHGTITEREGRGTDGELLPYAGVVFDDGHGPSAIQVGVQTQSDPAPTCAESGSAAYYCKQTHVHGGVLTVLKTYEYPDHRAETKDWIAEFRASDGSLVSVDEWNAAAEKGAPVSRPEPPLKLDRLGAIATSGKWDKVIAAIPSASVPVKGAAD